ncbi:hypothetical protein AVEN_182945-1 [Araneus ventricosus]|uniref:MD-2-related lipid-recognition domain-containing protein n=1 Tax=Araneus ventricosus TaxID=182803 RepID=A0A4Y2FNV7_ARAVE|nr:hypothetical protein AVEN_182945-1 [Araneus ventricosus]
MAITSFDTYPPTKGTSRHWRIGSKKQIINIKKLSIYPDPIRLNEKRFNISFDVQVEEDIPSLSRIHLQAWKIRRGLLGFEWNLPAPCSLTIGCNVEHCAFFKHFGGESFSCPVKAQDLKRENLSVEMPELGGFFTWFASGNYWIKMKITGPNSEQLSCYSIKGEVKGGLLSPLDTVII